MTAAQPFRSMAGGRIDRGQTLRFTFNGKAYEGCHGDTLASALLANGVRVVGRSFKFHRPRGILSAGVEEPNALVGADTGSGMIPLVRATLLPLSDGLKAESQNCFPSVNFDVGRSLDLTRRIWPAGFYNKMFKWPSWRTYEWAVRHAAGLGRLPRGADPVRYRHRNAHCDLLVVGSGPFGLIEALSAARRGNDVILAEQDIEPGGSLLHDSMEIDGRASDDWLAATLAELGACANVRLLLNGTVAGYYDHNVLTVHQRSAAGDPAPTETFWKVRARRVVLASGAIEQPLMFANNDLPGIMLAGAMHKYAVRYGVHCGRRIVGVVNNDLAWRSLLALRDMGIDVPAIVDARQTIRPPLEAAAEERGIAVHKGALPWRALGRITARLLEFRQSDGTIVREQCDGIAMSGGLNPTVHLYSQAGGTLRYNPELACFVPGECLQNVTVTGAARGNFAPAAQYNIAERDCAPARKDVQWVDFQHDVTVSDIELAVRENYVSVEHMKRYTTLGMSVDQGKTSNLNALTLLGRLTNRKPDEVGTTTFRPNYMPVTLGAIAGNRRGEMYTPTRQLPAYGWHAAHGAVFDDYGGWKRPACYAEERQTSIEREVRLVRSSVGLFDGSPLGKIELKGPDTALFLDRIYANTMSSLLPGRVRYGLMLNESGVVIDDGVCIRLAEDHFLVNTTSGGAGRIAAWLNEWHQCEWPTLELIITPVTSQWAVATLAGPRARQVLEGLSGMTDLATGHFPHMSFRTGIFADGLPHRIQRVSFSGEMSYELSVPANHAAECFEEIFSAGEAHGIGLFGVEALLVLRLEKGFLHVGVDTDGTTTPLDLGFTRMIEGKQTDFIGARSLARPAEAHPDRRQLVGFVAPADVTIRAGAHFTTGEGDMRRSEGFVTSSCFSATLRKSIGLGLLRAGFQRRGQDVSVYDDAATSSVRITDSCFFDADGERMRA